MDMIWWALYAWILVYELPKGVVCYRASRRIYRRTYALVAQYIEAAAPALENDMLADRVPRTKISSLKTGVAVVPVPPTSLQEFASQSQVERMLALESLTLPDMMLYKHVFSKFFTILGLVGLCGYLIQQWHVTPLVLLAVAGLMSDWEDLRIMQWQEAQQMVTKERLPLDAPSFALPKEIAS